MRRSILLLVVFLSVLALPAFGSAVFPDGSYHEFLFGTVGTFATGCGGGCVATVDPVAEQVSTAPWTFTGPATLFVLDLFVEGDRFQIFDNSVSLGLTSVPLNTGLAPCTNDIGCAIGVAGYSRGTFALGAGPHSITIEVNQDAANNTGGAAVFRLSTPEPASFLLLGAGLTALGLFRKKRT